MISKDQGVDMRKESPSAAPRLVDMPWLRGHLEDGTVLAVEVGVDASSYYEAHVPGAVAVSWLDDLHESDRRGLPTQARTERLLGGLGVSPDTHVVLYGEDDNRYAAYAYWVLRYYGHERLSLLDGGRGAVLTAGGPVTTERTDVATTRYACRVGDKRVRVSRDELLTHYVGSPSGTALLDCRTPTEYRGREGCVVDLPLMRHRLGGHIPGARNLQHRDLLDPATGRFRSLGEIREVFADRGVGIADDVVLYCDVGDRSALGWFALHELLGNPNARNYDGGWSEYGSLVGAPVHR
jgi:thiosulfate/3-mercaptopyruvate sulfurtransferase